MALPVRSGLPWQVDPPSSHPVGIPSGETGHTRRRDGWNRLRLSFEACTASHRLILHWPGRGSARTGFEMGCGRSKCTGPSDCRTAGDIAAAAPGQAQRILASWGHALREYMEGCPSWLSTTGLRCHRRPGLIKYDYLAQQVCSPFHVKHPGPVTIPEPPADES